MASASLNLVRSIYAGWERGDFSSGSPAPAREWAHPEIEYVIADGPSPGRWTGVGGMTEGWRDFLRAWEHFRGEADEHRELDNQRVLVLVRFVGRGKASGLDLGQMRAKGAHLFHVRNGKVIKLVFYLDSEHALADLGLAPQPGSLGS
jgi:ketosteroid isomerase-like protein